MNTVVLTGLSSFVGGMLGSTLALYGPTWWNLYGPARCSFCHNRRLKQPDATGCRYCKACKACNSGMLYKGPPFS